MAGGSLRVCSAKPHRGLRGIPSTWRSPTARRPGGSPRCNRQPGSAALPPGRRVVALRGGRRGVALRHPRDAARPARAYTCFQGVAGPRSGPPSHSSAVHRRSWATAPGDSGCRHGCRHAAPAPLPAERRPVDLAQPNRAVARGRPSTKPPAVLASCAHKGPCGSPPGGRGDGAATVLETWLPAEGDPAVEPHPHFADVDPRPNARRSRW